MRESPNPFRPNCDGAVAPLRVYWLTPEFFPPEMAGMGIITSRLAGALAERGAEVQVITRQTLPRCAPRERIGRVEVRRLTPAGRMKGVGWRALPAMLIYIAKLMVLLIANARRYDVVIISGMKTIPLAAVPVCRLLGKPCVLRVESPFEIAEPISAESLAKMQPLLGRALSRALRAVQLATLRGADRVIAISSEIARRLEQLKYPQARMVCIPNAIDLRRFHPVSGVERERLRARLGYPPGRIVLLYAGRRARSKGVMLLMQVLPELIARHPNLFAVLVGSGRGAWDDCEEEVVAFRRRHHLQEHTKLFGHSDQLQQHFQAADLFVTPSDYEGFGLTTVESLACATPTVTTSVGIAPELVHHGVNGFLCPPKDAQALGNTIELALNERQRWPEIGRRAREAAAPFDVPRVIEQYVALCHELRGH